MTEAASLLADLVSRYGSLRSNPTERSGALAEGNPVAAKKKRRTKKQIAATKRMIKARKKAVRATKKAKKTVKRRVKRAKKKVAVKRRKKKATAVAAATPTLAEAFGSGGQPVAAKKKRKSRKSGKRRAKATRKRTRRTRRRSKKATGSPRRRRRRSRKKSSARRGVSVVRGGRTRTVRLKGSPKVKYIMVQEAKKTGRRKKRRASPKRRRKGGRKKGSSRKRRRNPIELNSPQMLANPTYGGLFSNAGPYNTTMLTNLGVAAVGIGFGLLVAEMVDRAVATRAPADDGSNKANHPWYGRNAVAAIQRRPDAMRYGAQIGGAAVSIGVAYLSRNMKGIGRIVPFLAGGMAVAFVANAAMKLFNWEIAPRIFKVAEAGEASWANRLFVLEQVATQDKVDELFEKWSQVGSLAANQTETPSIQGPLSADTSQDILTLAGKPKPEGLPLGLGGRPGPLVETGRVGQCTSCQGMNGCFASCPGLKADCASCKPSDGSGDSSTSTSDGGGGGGGRRCRYIVQPGDDVFALARAAGIDMNTVNLLNTGTPDQYWIVGSQVVLPNGMCNLVKTRIPTPNIPTGTPLLPQTPPPGTTTTTTVVLNQPTGNGGPGYRAVQPVVPSGGGGREVFTVVQPTQPFIPPVIAGIEDHEDDEDSIL